MTCKCVYDNVDSYLDGALEPQETQRLQQHIDTCEICAELVDQHEAFRDAMRSVEVEPIDPSTAARFLRLAQLEAEQVSLKSHRRQSFYKGFAAAALVVAFVGLASKFLPEANINAPSINEMAAINTVQEVQVIIYVPESMRSAKIVLKLPRDVSVDGYSGVRTLAWNTDLSQGANQLTLPLRLNPGSDASQVHSIVADVEYNNEVKSFELKVDLSGKKLPLVPNKPEFKSTNQSA